MEASDRRGVLRGLAAFWGLLSLGLGVRSANPGASLSALPAGEVERGAHGEEEGSGGRWRGTGGTGVRVSDGPSPRINPPQYSVKRRERDIGRERER